MKNIHDLLLESLKSYNWELIYDDDFLVKYVFEDISGNEYLVEFKNDYETVNGKKSLSNQYEGLFFLKNDDGYSVSSIVNVNPYRTIKTVLGDIMNDFISRKSWVKAIRMEGLAKDYEKDFITQRTKLYLRFLTRNPIKNFKLVNYGNRIKLIRQ